MLTGSLAFSLNRKDGLFGKDYLSLSISLLREEPLFPRKNIITNQHQITQLLFLETLVQKLLTSCSPSCVPFLESEPRLPPSPCKQGPYTPLSGDGWMCLHWEHIDKFLPLLCELDVPSSSFSRVYAFTPDWLFRICLNKTVHNHAKLAEQDKLPPPQSYRPLCVHPGISHNVHIGLLRNLSGLLFKCNSLIAVFSSCWISEGLLSWS